MKSFAFISCPKTIAQLKNHFPALKMLPDFILKLHLEKCHPFKVSRIKAIRSTQGKVIQGYFIICPLLGLPRSKEDSILKRVTEALHFAERLGVNTLGLDNHSAIISRDKEYILANSLRVPFTNGSTLSAWSIIEAIYRTSKMRKIDLRKSKVAIIEASSTIGKLCARRMADFAESLILYDEDTSALEELRESILKLNSIEVIIEEDISKALAGSDIVITDSHFLKMQGGLEGLKPDAVVYSIGELGKASISNMIIRGGLIRLAYPAELNLNSGLPKGIVSAALAETMLLTFEERFTNYSVGDNINPDKLEEIADIAVQHGFEVWVPQAPVL